MERRISSELIINTSRPGISSLKQKITAVGMDSLFIAGTRLQEKLIPSN